MTEGTNPSETSSNEVMEPLSALTVARFEPVGRWFEAYGLRRLRKQTLSTHIMDSSSSEDNESDLPVESSENEVYFRSLDPSEWKDQDHYRVLGLEELRYKATPELIRRAHKRKVLYHHPDKRKSRGENVKEGDDDYFSCITRACEILSNTIKRRSYDSVDPLFDDGIPANNTQNKDNFYKVFRPVFESNCRWTNRKRVPCLGDEKSSYEDVNAFYNFWYEFDSWREFSYLDEEEKEKGENREERRWIEKQNKSARLKRKKEETTRLRNLVDNAYACDPRISRFREEEKEKKLAQKRAKQDAIKQRAQEEERKKKEAVEEEQKKKEKEAEEAKAAAAVIRKEKEAQKKLVKKEKKTFRTCLKDFDYFTDDDAEKVVNMQDVDKLAELLSLSSLKDINRALTGGDKSRAEDAFRSKVKEINDGIEREKQEQVEKMRKQTSKESSSGDRKKWSDEHLQMLIKAVGLFPAGTVQRWETVANFINQHCETTFNHRDTLSKAKDLQKMDPSQRKSANDQAYKKFEKSLAPAASGSKTEEEISSRYISVAEQQIAETGTNPAPWTAEEQKRLEQSLKTFPASTAERWEKIAETVASRSKKDCMKRYKELAELVRAKKMATATTAAKSAAKKS